MSAAFHWDAPGSGDWWLVREHFPYPVSRMFSVLFPPLTNGWKSGGERYGLPTGEAQWGAVNGWMYYGPEIPLTEAELATRELTARRTVASSPWRDEVERWHEVERPRVIATNLELQSVDPADLDDDALAVHFYASVDNFSTSGRLHFEHIGFDVVTGLLFQAAGEHGVEPEAVVEMLTGASPATAAVDAHVQRIADALDAAGVAASVSTVDAMRAAGSDAATVISAYLEEYGRRPVAGHDLLEPTLGERPELLVAAVKARRTRVGRAQPAREAAAPAVDLPETVRVLLADARASYALRDDDVGVCFNWPLGLVRRAALEIGARARDRGRADDALHVLECEPHEAVALLDTARPDVADLAGRWATRTQAMSAEPPVHLDGGGPRSTPLELPPTVARLTAARNAVWAVAPPRIDAPLHGIGIGSEPATGVARVVRHPEELTRLEDGDVLVAATTTTAFNAVFPLLTAVVTEHGGLFSHTAILARELALPAVVGVADVFQSVRDGDLVEVDPVAGRVRVVARADA